jgi:hypothetical protein
VPLLQRHRLQRLQHRVVQRAGHPHLLVGLADPHAVHQHRTHDPAQQH